MKAFNPDFTFVYIDAEFTPDLHVPGGLVSLALHSERGSVYMVNAEANREAFCASDFCLEHIWPKLPLRSDGELNLGADEVMSYSAIHEMTDRYFFELTDGEDYRQRVGVVADHGTQDMQRIHSLFRNDWAAMPKWIPRRPFLDLATLEDLAGVKDGAMPQPDGTLLPVMLPDQAHHALCDAQWDHEVHEFLMDRSQAVRVASGIERLSS